QGADREVVEGRAGVRAASFPPPDHVVPLAEQLGGAPELQVRERRPEPGRELADRLPTTAWGVHRVLESDVGRGELVDDGRVEGLAPELREPTPDDSLVLLNRHDGPPHCDGRSRGPTVGRRSVGAKREAGQSSYSGGKRSPGRVGELTIS